AHLSADNEGATKARRGPRRVAAVRPRPRRHPGSTRMNESTLTQLKVIVERAVRPVRASTFRKRKMRAELLAHVSGAFEEEAANLGDDRTALERTALRFGNPAEVTGLLQASVSVSDGFRRFWEGRPGESPMRAAIRLAWVTGTLAVCSFVVALLTVGPI